MKRVMKNILSLFGGALILLPFYGTESMAEDLELKARGVVQSAKRIELRSDLSDCRSHILKYCEVMKLAAVPSCLEGEDHRINVL